MTYIPRKVHNTFMCNKLSLVLFASCETSSSEKLSKMCSSRPLYCGIEPNMPECEAKIGQIMPDFKGKTLEGNVTSTFMIGLETLGELSSRYLELLDPFAPLNLELWLKELM